MKNDTFELKILLIQSEMKMKSFTRAGYGGVGTTQKKSEVAQALSATKHLQHTK